MEFERDDHKHRSVLLLCMTVYIQVRNPPWTHAHLIELWEEEGEGEEEARGIPVNDKGIQEQVYGSLCLCVINRKCFKRKISSS